MSIMIVDDSPSVQVLFDKYLRSAGYTELLIAQSASDAFKHLGMDDSSSSGEEVDLILMDIMMPEMDGIEACRRIKSVSRLRDIPIIMVTELEEIKRLDDAFAVGAMDYMTKSLTKVDLLARVRSALALKQQTDARKLAYTQLEAANQELELSLTKVKLLTGLLPICSYCNKIRNDDGDWKRIESYIKQHSEADFTHCICPDCMLEKHPRAYHKMMQQDEGRET